MTDYDWSLFSFKCDGECGSIGTIDDGFNFPGDDCPRSWYEDDGCDGHMRLRGHFYYYDEDTGMEYEHDGEFTRRQWHDGVGQVSEHHQSFADFMSMFPNADYLIEED